MTLLSQCQCYSSHLLLISQYCLIQCFGLAIPFSSYQSHIYIILPLRSKSHDNALKSLQFLDNGYGSDGGLK